MSRSDMVIQGVRFSLTSDELRQLILDQRECLRVWLKAHASEADSEKWRKRCVLFDMLDYGAEHLEPDVTYELSRYELQSLFEVWEDDDERAQLAD